MKEILIPYGESALPLHVEEELLNAVIVPSETARASKGESETVADALRHPIDSAPLFELAKGKRKVTVVTSDHTRPVPSRITLPLLFDEIKRGNPDAEITVLIGTGMHRATTAEEMNARFGESLLKRASFFVHDSRDDGQMADLGTLPSGGRLLVNRLVTEADLIVSEGFIEPHFFAGFSGGRKSILPGVCSYQTVMYNHNSEFIANPNSVQGVLDGNPIHEDMVFAAKKAGLGFILNVLLDESKRIVEAYAGNPEAAHLAGCESCFEHAKAPAVPADIVVTSNGGYPLDQNVYQAVKGMTGAERCVRPGGIMIMCAEARDGHGGLGFTEWFTKRHSVREVMSDILAVPREGTSPDQWQSQILARVLLKSDCIFVTAEKNRGLIERMFMTWAPDPDTALALARRRLGENASVTVLPNGVNVIPY